MHGRGHRSRCLLKIAGAGLRRRWPTCKEGEQEVVKENTTSKSASIVQIKTDNRQLLVKSAEAGGSEKKEKEEKRKTHPWIFPFT